MYDGTNNTFFIKTKNTNRQLLKVVKPYHHYMSMNYTLDNNKKDELSNILRIHLPINQLKAIPENVIIFGDPKDMDHTIHKYTKICGVRRCKDMKINGCWFKYV